MSMGVYTLFYIRTRGFLYAYSTGWVFSGPQNTDKQDRNPRFFCFY